LGDKKTISSVFFVKKHKYLKKIFFFLQKKLYFFIGWGILLINGWKMFF